MLEKVMYCILGIGIPILIVCIVASWVKKGEKRR